MDEYGIHSYGVGMTTLEEVFIKCKQDEKRRSSKKKMGDQKSMNDENRPVDKDIELVQTI